MKPNKGITLIALVVTIVVLLILAGVTIAMLTGENGIITNAKKAGFETRKEEAREKISVVLEGALIDKQTKPEYNQNEYLDNYVQSYLPDIEITEDEIDLNGFVFELDRSVPKLGEYIGEANNLPPRIKSINVKNKTLTSITVEVDVLRKEGVEYRYFYKPINEDQYKFVEQNKLSVFTYENLFSPQTYEIKVGIVKENNLVEEKSVFVKLGELEEKNLNFGEVKWNNCRASITVSTNTSYQIQYQINSTKGEWTAISNGGTIENLLNETEVYARLVSGNSSTVYISRKIIDDKKPTLKYNLNTLDPAQNVIITVTATDMESGIASIKTPNGEEIKNQNTADIKYNVNQNGEYVFTAKDNAGNISEELKVVVNNIRIKQTFNYTGSMQTFTVPKDGKYKIEAYGAQGQTGGSSYTKTGERW